MMIQKNEDEAHDYRISRKSGFSFQFLAENTKINSEVLCHPPNNLKKKVRIDQ